MVKDEFTVSRDGTGWTITANTSGKSLQLPSCIYEKLNGKYITADEFLDKIETLVIALAGVTNSLNTTDAYSLDRRSVLCEIRLRSGLNSADDFIVQTMTSVEDYEKYHTIFMGRDKKGDDNSIHAYLFVPIYGELRCRFNNSDGFRLNAKRNNITYWIDDYKIEEGTNGGKYVIPKGTPIEIM